MGRLDNIGNFRNGSLYYIYAEPPGNSSIYDNVSGISVSASVGANRFLLCGYTKNDRTINPYFSNDLSDFGPGLDNFGNPINSLNYQLGALQIKLTQQGNFITPEGIHSLPDYTLPENFLKLEPAPGRGLLIGVCHPYTSETDCKFRLNNGISGFLDYAGPSLFKADPVSFIDNKFTSYKTHGLSLTGSGSSIGFVQGTTFINFGVSNLTGDYSSFYRSLSVSALQQGQAGVMEINQGTSTQYMIYKYIGSDDNIFHVDYSPDNSNNNGTSILDNPYFGISSGLSVGIKIPLRNYPTNFKSFGVSGIKFYLHPVNDLLTNNNDNELITAETLASQGKINFYNAKGEFPNATLNSLIVFLDNLVDSSGKDLFTSDYASLNKEVRKNIVSHHTICGNNVTTGPDCNIKGNPSVGDIFSKSKNGETSEIILIAVSAIFVIFFIAVIVTLIKMYGEGN